MSDRYYALSVALKEDTRDEDAQAIIGAIRMIRGVLAVETHISDIGQWTANVRARDELGGKLWNILYPKQGQK